MNRWEKFIKKLNKIYSYQEKTVLTIQTQRKNGDKKC